MTQDDNGPKKLNLTPPPKVSVQTNIGQLYVRRMNMRDIQTLSQDLGNTDSNSSNLGRKVLTTLVGRNQDPQDKSAISSEEVDLLQQADLDNVIAHVCDSNGFKIGEGTSSLERLGEGTRTFITEAFRPLAEVFAKAHDDFTKSFKGLASLSSITKSSLVNNLSEIAKLTESFKATRLSPEIQEYLKKASAPLTGTAALQEALKGISPRVNDEIFRRTENVSSVLHPIEPRLIPEQLHLDPSKTPIGRAANAAEDTAEQLKQVAMMTKDMAEAVGTLTQNIVGHALPEWMKKLDEDRTSAATNIQHAAKSLSWTKWAIIVAVVLGIVSLWADYRYNTDNGRQQERIEKLMLTQTETMRRIQEEQAQEVAALKQALAQSLAAKAYLPHKIPTSPEKPK